MARLIPLVLFGAGGPTGIAARLGVSPETARRWFYQRARMPRLAQRAAQVILQGDLGVIDDAWRGCRIRGDRLILDDTGDTFTAGQLRAYRLRLQLHAYYERQIEILTAELNKKRQAQGLASWQQLMRG